MLAPRDARELIGRRDRALGEALDALGVPPERSARAWRHLERALGEQAAGRLEGARRECEDALELADGPALEGVARLMRGGMLEGAAAVTELARAARLLGSAGDALARGWAWAALADRLEAHAELAAPDEVAGVRAEAVACFERASRPEHAAAVELRAAAAALRAERPAAAERLARAALDRLGVLVREGVPGPAPDDARVRRGLAILGHVARTRGRRGEARACWRAALAGADPSGESTRELRDALAALEAEPGPYR